MHSFTAIPAYRFECECGYEFFVGSDEDQNKIRRQIAEHRQATVFEEGNSYKQPWGDQLTAKKEDQQ